MLSETKFLCISSGQGMATERKCSEASDLLQPELWSREALRKYLQNHHVSVVEDCDKADLVELFHRTVVPLPQRKYRANRRGVLMTQTQKRQDGLKRKHDAVSEDQHNPGSGYRMPRVTNGSSLLGSLSRLQTSTNRLKPPVSDGNFQRKIIQLGSSKTSPSHLRASKVCCGNQQITTTSHRTAAKCGTMKRDSGSISSPHVDKTTLPSQTIIASTPPRKIKLKRVTPQSDDGCRDSCANAKKSTNVSDVHISHDRDESISSNETSSTSNRKDPHSAKADEDQAFLQKKFKRIDIKFP